jgi:hypothetical protein
MVRILAFLLMTLTSCTTPATRDQYMICETYCYVEKACVSTINDWLICDCYDGNRIRIDRWTSDPKALPGLFFRLEPEGSIEKQDFR